ncbi:serine/arginine-rich splicing factor 4 [Ranitomeya variabilis]|uniref:serine/arginine-rich splicing factor 4 n=1 Tax=Ranitomeya variabilis TaxID=490064 RepID=UPI004056F586
MSDPLVEALLKGVEQRVTPPPTAQIPNKNFPLTSAPPNPSSGAEHSYLLTPPPLCSTAERYTDSIPPCNNKTIPPITPINNAGRRRRRQTSSQSSSNNSRRHSRYPSKRPSRHRRRRSSHRSRRRSRASGWRSSETSETSEASLSPGRSHRPRDKSSKSRAPSKAFSRGEQSPAASSHNSHAVAEDRAINPPRCGCNRAPTHDTQTIGQHIGQSLAVAGARVSPSCDITPSTSAGVPPGSEYTRPESHSGFQNPAAQRATPWYSVSTVPVGHSGQSLMPLIRASVSPATWQVYGVDVWVVGDSYVHWAEKRAKLRPGGTNLYIPGIKVNWRGIRGLRWNQVFKEMVGIARMAERPVILVLHAGGNDLGKQKVAELYKWVTTDMERFSWLFRNMILVWSEITPRAEWRGARDKRAIERTRVKFNARIGKYVRGRGGIVIHHQYLQKKNTPQLRPDGVHLTDIGLDIFLSGLQDGVEQALKVMGGVGVPRR